MAKKLRFGERHEAGSPPWQSPLVGDVDLARLREDLPQTLLDQSVMNMELLDARAAGIDVGSETMHVSVGAGPAVCFRTTTAQLIALRDYLKSQGVRSVAMEATGIYWLTVYDVLEAAGMKVTVVNGRHVKGPPARKTDVQDCVWLSKLHCFGLLQSGFVPPADIRELQDYVRLRSDHITMAASHVQHMQKALERMNIKVHDTIRSLTGVSGMRMVRAIVEGERNPETLVALCDAQILKKKRDLVLEALQGTWKAEHVFALRQALELWDFYQAKIVECDQCIAEVLNRMSPPPEPPLEPPSEPPSEPPKGDTPTLIASTKSDVVPKSLPRKTKGQPSKNAPRIGNLGELLAKFCKSNDITAIPGLTEYSLLLILSEVGTDLTKWPTAKHFTSWMGLAPGSHQSGKRSRSQRREVNRAGRIFCNIVQSLTRSKDMAIGAFLRRLKVTKGGPLANKAAARKLAELFWRLMVYGQEYIEEGVRRYEERVMKSKLRSLKAFAKECGFDVVPRDTPVPQVVG